MKPTSTARCLLALVAALALLTGLLAPHAAQAEPQQQAADPPEVHAANLVYATKKTSVCFSDQFLTQIAQDTNIRVDPKFAAVQMESDELFEYPFAVMSGEGKFSLTEAQRDNLKEYLTLGGFLVASAGCSSRDWNRSFEKEMQLLFPDSELTTLESDHPVFHSVYDVTSSRYKHGAAKLPELRGLEVDGRIVMIWSPDGLNDTANAGGNCCCCGGNEVKSAKLINVNLLAYALTH